MSLIITADGAGNACVDNGLYISSMSLIIAAGSDDDACVENGLYRPAISFITAEDNVGVQVFRIAYRDKVDADFSCTL